MHWRPLGPALAWAVVLLAALLVATGPARAADPPASSGATDRSFSVELWDSADVDGDVVRVRVVDELDPANSVTLLEAVTLAGTPFQPVQFRLREPVKGALVIERVRDSLDDEQIGMSGISVASRVVDLEDGYEWSDSWPQVSESITLRFDWRDEAGEPPLDLDSDCGRRQALGLTPSDPAEAARHAEESAQAAFKLAAEADRIIGGWGDRLARATGSGSKEAEAAVRDFTRDLDLPPVGPLQDALQSATTAAIKDKLTGKAIEKSVEQAVKFALGGLGSANPAGLLAGLAKTFGPAVVRLALGTAPPQKALLDATLAPISELMDHTPLKDVWKGIKTAGDAFDLAPDTGAIAGTNTEEARRLGQATSEALDRIRRVRDGLDLARGLLAKAASRSRAAACAARAAGGDPQPMEDFRRRVEAVRRGIERADAHVARLERFVQSRFSR